jgi:fluoroquinolone resistance protein
MTFPELSYYQQIFSRLTLKDEIISAREFEDCRFEACSFTACTFDKVKFINCVFDGCFMSVIKSSGSRFLEVKFTKCKELGFNWSKTDAVRDLSFNECQLNYSDFSYLKIPGIKILGCEAKEVDFTEADLTGADLQNTDFENSRFYNTNLSGADLRGAWNFYIDVTNNELKKARFSFAGAVTLLNGLDIVIE